jgi:hypothetical protein
MVPRAPSTVRVPAVRVLGERPAEPAAELLAHRLDAAQQPVVPQPALHGERSRAGGCMADVPVPLLERAAAPRRY